MRWLLSGALLWVGCGKKRVEAPAEMEEIATFIFENYDDDDSILSGIEALIDWILPNLGSEQAQVGYTLGSLSEANIANIEHPGRDVEELLGAAVLGVSPHTMEAHALTMVLDDQTYANPGNYDFYTRAVETEDLQGFLAGAGRANTVNDIQTASFGVRIPYTLHKDYRWITDEFGTAIMARSHIPASGCASGGDNCLMASFSDDIWLRLEGRQDTIRFTATWNEVVSPAQAFITEQQQINALASGMVRVFTNTDAFIADGGVE